jgi:hypothetical protein
MDRELMAYGNNTYGNGLYGTSGVNGIITPDFTLTPISGEYPLSVQFTDTSTCSSNQTISRWLWEFGDGTTSDLPNPLHVYLREGTYSVSLTVYTDGYDNEYDPGINAPELTYATKTVGIAVTVNIPTDKKLEGRCLRYATEDTEGQGWSDIKGFVDPVQDGAYIIYDDNDVPRCIVEDEDGKIYEVDTFDRVDFLKPPFADKIKFDGTEGTPIVCKKLGAELTAGAGYEDTTVCDYMTWVHIRPDDPLNRGKGGYDTEGFRDGQAVNLEVFADGEKITSTAKTVDIPENSDIVFSGHPNIQATRLQYQFTFNASEFKLVEIKNQLLVKQSFASIPMTENTYQDDMGYGLVLYMTRGNPIFDRVTKQIVSIT